MPKGGPHMASARPTHVKCILVYFTVPLPPFLADIVAICKELSCKNVEFSVHNRLKLKQQPKTIAQIRTITTLNSFFSMCSNNDEMCSSNFSGRTYCRPFSKVALFVSPLSKKCPSEDMPQSNACQSKAHFFVDLSQRGQDLQLALRNESNGGSTSSTNHNVSWKALPSVLSWYIPHRNAEAPDEGRKLLALLSQPVTTVRESLLQPLLVIGSNLVDTWNLQDLANDLQLGGGHRQQQRGEAANLFCVPNGRCLL
jgi:hypothetical protein